MAKKKLVKKSVKQAKTVEPDSIYFLKIILYFVLGCLWVTIGGEDGIPIPVGLLIGIIFAMHDHFKIDRKIEFAVLLVATILSFVAPIGFVLTIG